jgi:putative ABC transport system permease protein
VSLVQKIRSLGRNLFRREKVERELDAEVRSYSDLLEEENLSRGMNPIEARRSARINMSGPEQLKEEIRSARAGAWLESLWQDVRYATRLLRKNPGFTTVAVFTLALGIGANTAIFSIVNAVALRPLPYKGSERLVSMKTSATMLASLELGNSWVAFEQVQKNASVFEQLTAYRSYSMTLTDSGDPARISVMKVANGFFDLFGAGPQIGRLFVTGDQVESQGRAAVLSDAFWRTHFGADPAVLGRTIVLNKEPYVVVGVAARGFAYPQRATIWLPIVLSNDFRQNAVNFDVEILARLRRGATLAQAQSQLDVIAGQIAAVNPPLKDGYKLQVATVLSRRVGNVRPTYLMLFAASSFVLLIACANLASFIMSRGSSRQREMAMRAALGASRGRLLRQTLVENCLLGFLGGAAGAILASFGISAFRVLAAGIIPRTNEITADPAMFWFAIGSAFVAGILFGIVPALRAARSDPNSALREGAVDAVSPGGSRQSRLGGVLVISEIALAFILLIGAVVTVEGFKKLLSTDSGMRTDHLVTFNLPLGAASDQGGHYREYVNSLHAKIQDVLGRLRALPGVTEAAVTDHGVLSGALWVFTGYSVEGRVAPLSAAARTAQGRQVSAGYFETLGVRLLRGRLFTEQDVSNSEKVAIINEATAKEIWGSVDAVDRQFRKSGDSSDLTRVVGVVANTHEVDLNSPAQPVFYFPILQESPVGLQLIVRTAQDPAALASLISREVRLVDKDQPITNIATMDQIIYEHASSERLSTALLSFFGAIGLGLALLGVYGVVAYSVSRRTREIGIRMALGANPFDVMRMVIRQGLILALIGVAIGAVGAVALKQVLQNNFTVANTNDVATYSVAGVLVIIVACLACYVPARRAMRVDPMAALRHE